MPIFASLLEPLSGTAYVGRHRREPGEPPHWSVLREESVTEEIEPSDDWIDLTSRVSE